MDWVMPGTYIMSDPPMDLHAGDRLTVHLIRDDTAPGGWVVLTENLTTGEWRTGRQVTR